MDQLLAAAAVLADDPEPGAEPEDAGDAVDDFSVAVLDPPDSDPDDDPEADPGEDPEADPDAAEDEDEPFCASRLSLR